MILVSQEEASLPSWSWSCRSGGPCRLCPRPHGAAPCRRRPRRPRILGSPASGCRTHPSVSGCRTCPSSGSVYHARPSSTPFSSSPAPLSLCLWKLAGVWREGINSAGRRGGWWLGRYVGPSNPASVWEGRMRLHGVLPTRVQGGYVRRTTSSGSGHACRHVPSARTM